MWNPTPDSIGRLVTSKKPLRGFRRFVQELWTGFIAMVAVSAFVQHVGHNNAATGIVALVVLVGVLCVQTRSHRWQATDEADPRMSSDWRPSDRFKDEGHIGSTNDRLRRVVSG